MTKNFPFSENFSKDFLKLRKVLNLLDKIKLKAIEFLREKKKIPRPELIDGVITQSAYSKIKHGSRRLRMNETEKLLLRLNARNQDIEDIIGMIENEDLTIVKEFRDALDNPTEEKIKCFYQKIESSKHQKIEHLRFSLMIENHFHDRYSGIPPVDYSVLTKIFNQVAETDYLTTLDYQFIGDFTIFLSANENLFQKIVTKLIDIKFSEVYSIQKTVQYYLPQALTNILDILVDQHHFSQAKQVLSVYRQYIDYFNDHQYKLLADYFEYRLNYFSAETIDDQKKILDEIGEFLKNIQTLFPNMNQTKQIEQSYTRLKDGHSLGKPLYYFRKS